MTEPQYDFSSKHSHVEAYDPQVSTLVAKLDIQDASYSSEDVEDTDIDSPVEIPSYLFQSTDKPVDLSEFETDNFV